MKFTDPVTLNWLFGITTIIGTILTIAYGQKSARLERESKSITWTDVQSAANDLASDVRGDFIPELIFAPGARGGILAHMMAQELGPNTPVFIGFCEWKGSRAPSVSMPSYQVFDTNKWRVHMPGGMFSDQSKRVLIVDDFAASGDAMEKIRDAFVTDGFALERIKLAAIVTTKVAINNKKAPNYYWRKADSIDFYFPWGRAK